MARKKAYVSRIEGRRKRSRRNRRNRRNRSWRNRSWRDKDRGGITVTIVIVVTLFAIFIPEREREMGGKERDG